VCILKKEIREIASTIWAILLAVYQGQNQFIPCNLEIFCKFVLFKKNQIRPINSRTMAKPRKFKKFLRALGLTLSAIILLVLLAFGSFLAYMSFTDYKPADIENIPIASPHLPSTIHAGKLNFYTWNIGYCGLGSAMDFFYEGGTMVMPSKDYYQQCRDGVINQITSFEKPDFVFIQEIDRHSHRTYYDDQLERVKTAFPGYMALYATNYRVPFVPVPVSSPMGKVESGIMTLSHFQPLEAIRYQYPSSYSWPKKLFLLDRCMMLGRYNVDNGKQLVLINTHNSAYDDAAEMRSKELGLLKSVMTEEFDKGNYVVVGGDWNQNPLPYNKSDIQDGNSTKVITPPIPDDFLPAGFTWAYDPQHPTNRDVDHFYQKGKTPTTIIDFFVLSPNIKLHSVNAVISNFQFSDHQPVSMIVELLEK